MENISQFIASLHGNIIIGIGIVLVILFVKFIKEKLMKKNEENYYKKRLSTLDSINFWNIEINKYLGKVIL